MEDSTMKEKNFIIQGFFSGGYGWEDLASYPQGYRQTNRHEARQQAKKDLQEYRESGVGSYRIIERYEEQ